jgi:capsular exopolysaccharide synthesis family protein
MSVLTGKHKYKLVSHYNSNPIIAEAYRTLRTNIQFASGHLEIKTLLVTSTIPNEGKSTTISNLAMTYAEMNQKVLLIDADLRRPTLHRIFSSSIRFGLSNLLTNQCKLEDAITETFVPNLSLITSGPMISNPYELLGSNRIEELLNQLKPLYDIILIDSSPVLAVSDSQLLSVKCDGVLYVVNYGKVKRAAAQKAIASLSHAEANVLGVVINNKKRIDHEAAYYY